MISQLDHITHIYLYKMPRRTVLTSNEFSGYQVNAGTEKPVYQENLRRVVDVVEACRSGRWELVHTVIWLNPESRSISPLLKKLSSRFGPGCFRYVWSKESASDEDSQHHLHYHIATFYNAQKHSFSTLSGGLAGLMECGYLQNYKLVKPQKHKITSPELCNLLTQAVAPTHGLDLRDPRNVAWAVYWCSYLAKTASKESVPGRTFGSSAISRLR